MANEFPHIYDADEILRELSYVGINSKYTGDLKEKAVSVIEDELGCVKRQGSASGYLVLINALKEVGALETAEEFAVGGIFASSLISYATGLSDIEPLNSKPKLYSEFFFGIHNNRMPSFELIVSADLLNRLMEYFDNYPGEEPVERKYDPQDQCTSVYIGEIEEETIENVTFNNTFHIDFKSIEDEEGFHNELMSNDVIDASHPKTYADYVKCYGLKHGTGVWENNAEILMHEGKVPFNDLIAHREDVYEYLLERELDRNTAYEIAEYVRKGMAYRYGLKPEMKEALDKADVAPWFIGCCEKIRYLPSRANAMALYSKYYKELL